MSQHRTDKPFSSTAEVFSWLEGFSNFEKKSFSLRNFRLDRMEKLLEFFDKPHKSGRYLHIAGSKGKGSTAAFLASILKTAGFVTGLYTSPHLVSYKERISLAGEEIDDEVFIRQGNLLRGAIENSIPEVFPGGEFPTTFELLTCLGFMIFRDLKCDWVVLETGMGGRLDATNVVIPAASILTPIELEHTEYLGDTIAAIAEEKAGIIKKGIPVFIAPQSPEALEVFRRAAAAKGCPVFYLSDFFPLIKSRTLADGQEAQIKIAKDQASLSLRLRLRGEVQAENSSLALLTVMSVFPDIPFSRVVAGLEDAYIPGRFQKLADSPAVFVDGSHTPVSVRRLLSSFRELYPSPDTLILGIVSGKRCEEIAATLCPAFRSVIVTTPGTFKASDPGLLHSICLNYNPRALLIPDPARALDAAKRDIAAIGSPETRAILVTGSFYLAGEILKTYGGLTPS